MKTSSSISRQALLLAALLAPCAMLRAQSATTDKDASTSSAKDDDVILLTPFEVNASRSDTGYTATHTLAGNRLNTDLRDIGSSVTVYTSQLFKDIGATNNTSLLQYTVSSEVGGVYGNFAGTGDSAALSEPDRPSQTTRIRGLAAADNTRDFFHSEIPWDSYNIDRVDLQRGPNAILFGEGSPAGIINADTKQAMFKNSGEVEMKVGSYGSSRESLDLNRVLVPRQVAIRLDLLNDQEKYEQKPAFSNDRRISGSIRYEPALLNQNGFHFVAKAGFESGRIDSNNPRELPPQDQITPFFGSGAAGTNQATYNGWQLWDNQTGRIGSGVARPTNYANASSMPIPYSSPWIENSSFGNTNANNPVAFFGNGGGAQTAYWVTSATQQYQGNHQIGYVTAPGSWASIAPTSIWAVNSGLPYSSAGIFKNNVLTDPSIFNFYKKLIDGDTKHEMQQFHRETFNVAETALNDQVGISFDYNKEYYKYTHTALLGGNVALFIDPMSVYNNGTSDAGLTGVPYSDGTPNPNVGRPFVSTTGGSNYSNATTSEDKRVTAYVTRDFNKDLPGWLGRIVGKHTVTGLWADSTQTTDSRGWDSYGYLDQNAYNLQDPHLNPATVNFTTVEPAMVMYLGPSLLGKSASGANIPVISGTPAITNGLVTYFNDTWNAPGVDPTAPWTNNAYTTDPSKLAPGYPVGNNPLPSSFTQANNPANYVGWTTQQLNITQANSAANRDLLATSAALNRAETTSKALIWQGKMLDDSIVATFGWRKDTARAYGVSRNIGDAADPQSIDFSNYGLPSGPNGVISVTSRSESFVVHLMDLPGVKDLTKSLPFDVSLTYNQSTNFQPLAGRVDVYGAQIAPPSGKTIDRGIVISTRDGKYSLKINRYVTSERNITTNAGSFANDFNWWMGSLVNFTNMFDPAIQGGPVWGPLKGGSNIEQYTFSDDVSVQSAALKAQQTAALAGVRAFENSVDPRFWKAWGFNSLAYIQSNQTGNPYVIANSIPNGFTITEDGVSKGVEVELNANPFPNWRITFNASKEDAVRSNIGGTALNGLMNQVATMVNGDGGLMHFWWGTSDVPNDRLVYYTGVGAPGSVGADWANLKLVEGAAAPEIRTWHYNLITNYEFTHRFLKGFNVGGGVRYQSGDTIGYPPLGDPSQPATLAFDLAHPYKGPSETNLDLWVGYHRKIWRNIDWHIQLNIANLGKHDYLIPITVQGPIAGQAAGTPAGYRIGPTQTFQLTSRFTF
ncbi:catecholate siderophore receptor Fiu precursor [mine drainage metagenome]|uniref:Catecholate siderophore receptor Fiu n=1 Tax=mine drainage metagenome TaxID=410659 RepID=A0A1J5SIX5_9ZZZZ